MEKITGLLYTKINSAVSLYIFQAPVLQEWGPTMTHSMGRGTVKGNKE